MVRRLLAAVVRILPRGIPVGIVLVGVSIFWLQNHTTITRQGEFLLATDWDLAREYPPKIAGDPPYTERERDESSFVEPAAPERTRIAVADKYRFYRTAGFSFLGRGHSISYTSVFPKFYSPSPFQQQLSRQLHREAHEQAIEFATVNWSDVVDGLKEPQFYLLNWETQIDVDVVHTAPQAVSLLESRYQYTGGAHGNLMVVGRCFVEEQNQVRELKLSDLFDPDSDWLMQLSKYCLSDLRCQGASSAQGDDMLDQAETRFAADDLCSFTLSPSGIRFYFSPYHVGCYAEGVYAVHVPYYVIADCIAPDSPARFFMAADDHDESMN